jgi:hypothetical protein
MKLQKESQVLFFFVCLNKCVGLRYLSEKSDIVTWILSIYNDYVEINC